MTFGGNLASFFVATFHSKNVPKMLSEIKCDDIKNRLKCAHTSSTPLRRWTHQEALVFRFHRASTQKLVLTTCWMWPGVLLVHPKLCLRLVDGKIFEYLFAYRRAYFFHPADYAQKPPPILPKGTIALTNKTYWIIYWIIGSGSF